MSGEIKPTSRTPLAEEVARFGRFAFGQVTDSGPSGLPEASRESQAAGTDDAPKAGGEVILMPPGTIDGPNDVAGEGPVGRSKRVYDDGETVLFLGGIGDI